MKQKNSLISREAIEEILKQAEELKAAQDTENERENKMEMEITMEAGEMSEDDPSDCSERKLLELKFMYCDIDTEMINAILEEDIVENVE